MKKIIVALAALCLVFASVSLVQAQSDEEPVTIYLDYSDDTVYVSASDSLVLRHAWGACTQGLLHLYLSAVHTEIGLNGEMLAEADGKSPYWLPLYESPDVNLEATCIAGDKQGLWVAAWEYPLGTLPPGEYELSYKNWYSHKITDGADSDGDGTLDRWSGIFNERIITIYVE